MSSLVYFVHALSPVHMGTGASTGGIDLPLAREVSTGWPLVPGSAIKGVLRADGGVAANQSEWLFGSPWDVPDNRDQGALMFSEARILCLPVRSYSGGWAWVTSPLALSAYHREAGACLPAAKRPPATIPAPADAAAHAADPQTPLKVGTSIHLHDIMLALAAPAQPEPAATWADHLGPMIFGAGEAVACAMFKARFLIVSEAVFAYLAIVGMDVRTRVRLKENKVVADSGPWVEESLPVETVLWGSVAADPILTEGRGLQTAQQAIDVFAAAVSPQRRIQIGGKATVGRGVVRWVRAA